MPDNYGFSPGSGATARSKNPSGSLHLPYVYVATGEHTVVGFESAGITSAQLLPNMSVHSAGGATHALVAVDTGGGNIRFREDGTNPTASVGMLVQAGFAVEFMKLTNIKIISTSATTSINISYRRYDQ